MSIGQQSTRAASTQTTQPATSAGRRRLERDGRLATQGATRALRCEKTKKRHRGAELGDGEQHPRRERERRRRRDAQRALQHQNKQSFAHADAAGREERQESREVRRREHRDGERRVEPRRRQQPAREQPEREAVTHPGDEVGRDAEHDARRGRRAARLGVGRARGGAAGGGTAARAAAPRPPPRRR